MDTKEKILEQTFNLIMKYGIKSVSMDDISRGIGISKKTIYQYFDTKKGLIVDVLTNHIAEDEKELVEINSQSSNAIDEMVRLARHVLNFLRTMSPSLIYDVRKYYPVVWGKIEDRHFNFILSMINDNIERGQREGMYNLDIDAGVISKLYIQQSLSLIDDSLFPSNDYIHADLFRNMIVYHIRGLMNDKGRSTAKELIIE